VRLASCHFNRTVDGQPQFGRYLAVVLNGTRNPHRQKVAHDILDAIMQTRASQKPKKPATYWDKRKQEENMVGVFERWAKQGVWSAAASKVRAQHPLQQAHC
jgi:hypothetical protein